MRNLRPLRFALAITLALSVLLVNHAGADPVPVGFYGRGESPLVDLGSVDRAITPPDEFLGFPLGERPARHAQVVAYLEHLASQSPRIQVSPMGATYEGRALVYAVISSPDHMRRLDEIRSDVQRIADPRQLPKSDLDAVVERTPAVVWLAYSIHGDEISGVDAGIGVAYRLVAGTDTLTERLLRDLIIIIDPIENPDGRERYLAQMESFASAVPSADGQSLQKEGFWPWGRGNHYLFDMNRDWFAQELIESQARIAAIVPWQPHVFVDAHEMGRYNTYLFSPPRAPFTPQLSMRMREWWDTFAGDQGRAFDRHGWAYYTREWNEEWYPGYGSSWPLFQGAVGILYEQAGVSGSRVARHDGTVLTYSESVAHQYVSSMANLETASSHREALLREYYTYRERAIEEFGGGPAKAFVIRPDANRDRLDHLAVTLQRQGVEVYVAGADFSMSAENYYHDPEATEDFPAGSMIIPADQPTGFLIQAILDFDLRMSDSVLAMERRELSKHRDSKLYEVTSWSMLQAYGLDAYRTRSAPGVDRSPWTVASPEGSLSGHQPLQGFAFSVESDRHLRAMAMLFARGITMYAARKDLDVEGRDLHRGAIFIPRRANPVDYEETLAEVARATGVSMLAISSGKGVVGPDLGGGELGLLRQPRVAIVAAGPTSFTSMGALWHLLDQKLGVPSSLIDITRLGRTDLSVYSVLLLADSWGSYSGVIGEGAIDHIKKWVRSGGTLIAMEGAAAFCADTTVGLSSVRVRRQVLDELADYEEAAEREIAAEKPDMSDVHVWDYPAQKDTAGASEPKAKRSTEEIEKTDELARVFSPHGAILRVNLDQEHWLTAGVGERVPALLYSTYALLARFPAVRTVGRFADREDIRVSGLLWPEARERLARTAYCTREGMGQGQVILFAGQPNFRAYFRGAERLLSNAILFGPGMGTRWTPDW